MRLHVLSNPFVTDGWDRALSTRLNSWGSEYFIMLTKLPASRSLQCLGVLLVAILLAGLASAPILRGIALFLIVEDPLEHAAAIVPLAGQTPFREMEAAKLYRAGLAPQVVIVQGAPNAESEALRDLGIRTRGGWDVSREVLIQQGVPASAIVVLTSKAGGDTRRAPGGLQCDDFQRCARDFGNVEVPYPPNPAHMAIRHCWQVAADRPCGNGRPLRSESLVAAAELCVVCSPRISRAN